MSQMFEVGLIGSWILIPITFWRIVFGKLLNEAFFWFWAAGVSFTFNASILYIVEFFAIKYVFIVVKKQVLPILDDFFGRFFYRMNRLVVIAIFMTSSFSKGTMSVKFKYTGMPEVLGEAYLPLM